MQQQCHTFKLAQNHLYCLNSRLGRPYCTESLSGVLQTQLLNDMPPDQPAVMQNIQQRPMKHQQCGNMQG